MRNFPGVYWRHYWKAKPSLGVELSCLGELQDHDSHRDKGEGQGDDSRADGVFLGSSYAHWVIRWQTSDGCHYHSDCHLHGVQVRVLHIFLHLVCFVSPQAWFFRCDFNIPLCSYGTDSLWPTNRMALFLLLVISYHCLVDGAGHMALFVCFPRGSHSV